MRFFVPQGISIIAIVALLNCGSSKEFDPKEIPTHVFFVKRDIKWQESPYDDLQYMKAIGKKDIDSMLILTSDKLILIAGQYGLKPGDTVIMPYSGEFGISYDVSKNDNYRLFKDTLIKINGQEFITTQKAKFEWWPEITNKIKKIGKGKVIVSGP